MATIAQKPRKSFYAHLHDDSGILALHDGRVLFFSYDGPITPVSSYAGLVVLGEAALADTQVVLDRMHGGPVGVCTSRRMEVQ
jgi:hypothetical protein